MTYKVLPITIRSLESLIRLATAHAKLRLSQVVEHSDAFEAVSLFAYSLFGSDFDRHFSM
jgi:DNA replicative helicase MCM subunit Mcm2 (Cdc46/Mcm family)